MDGPKGHVTERLFLAVALDDDARHALAARITAMTPAGLPGRPVPVRNWHVTLRFVGRSTETARDLMLSHLAAHMEEAPFRIRFEGLGAFPTATRAAVLWVAVADDSGGLTRVAGVCEEAAVAAGFAPEDRPFHAHLTVARIRPTQPVLSLVESARSAGVRMDVGAVTMYRSIPGGGSARYEVVDEVPLS